MTCFPWGAMLLAFPAVAAGWFIYELGIRRGIARANAIARDEHAAAGFHVSEDTQP